MTNQITACRWCGRSFAPRASGGKPQRFCRAACRRALDAAGRRWVAVALADGSLTTEALRSGLVETRALPMDAEPGTVAFEVSEVLADLVVALPEPVVAALPDDLFDRIALMLKL